MSQMNPPPAPSKGPPTSHLTSWLLSVAREAEQHGGHSRGILAELRRGARSAPNYPPSTLRHVIPRLPGNCSSLDEEAALLVATLFATAPQTYDVKYDFGWTMRRTAIERGSEGERDEGIEKRFMILLSSDPEEFPIHLRHAVSLAESAGIPIGWEQLRRNCRGMLSGNPDWMENVRRRWARSYWGWEPKEETSTETE